MVKYMALKRKTVYLDFDGTLTICKERYSFDKMKDNVEHFLRFLTDHFEVKWCSLNYEDIIEDTLKLEGIPEDITNKISWFNCSNNEYNKAAAIIKETKDFIFIDDDRIHYEIRALTKLGLQNNFIKANPLKEDLSDIENIIKNKFLKKIEG